MRRAQNAAQVGTYRFFVDDSNAVHFHTDAFLPDAVAASYRFGQAAMGDVISFTPSDTKFIAAYFGSGASVFWAVDSFSGQRVRLASTDIGGLPGPASVIAAEAAFIGDIFTEEQSPVSEDLVQSYIPIMARDQADFARQVRAKFDKLRQFQYQAEAEVRGTHGVIPLNQIRMDYFTNTAQEPHFLSGVFRVKEVEHNVSSGGWQTSFGLYRDGIPQVEGATPVTNARKVASKTDETTQRSDDFQLQSAAGKRNAERLTRTTRAGA